MVPDCVYEGAGDSFGRVRTMGEAIDLAGRHHSHGSMNDRWNGKGLGMVMNPTPSLDRRFGDPEATPESWDTALDILRKAEIFWLSTVRESGKPHVTPLIAVLVDEVLYFTTGKGEQKYVNLQANPHVVLATGTNLLHEGLDVIVEGVAIRTTDNSVLAGVAGEYARKYGPDWAFEAHDEALHHAEGGAAIAFRIEPAKVFGFRREGMYSQTRWRFAGS
jgi:hypothetical protein